MLQTNPKQCKGAPWHFSRCWKHYSAARTHVSLHTAPVRVPQRARSAVTTTVDTALAAEAVLRLVIHATWTTLNVVSPGFPNNAVLTSIAGMLLLASVQLVNGCR